MTMNPTGDGQVRRMIQGVAHDFNNVLATILGTIDLLLVRLPPDDPARLEVEEIRSAAHRGQALTRRLAAISRNEVPDTIETTDTESIG